MVSLTGSRAFHQSHAGSDANRSTNDARKMIQSGRKNSYRTREIMEGCIRGESISLRRIEFVRRFRQTPRIGGNPLKPRWKKERRGKGGGGEEKGEKEGKGEKGTYILVSIAMERRTCDRSPRRHGSIKRVTNGRERTTRDANS